MQKGLDRRKFLTALTVAMGGALSPLASTALKAAERFEASESLEALSKHQVTLLERFADIIIPATDTPGAAAAGAHLFIDHMVAAWMGKEHAAKFVTRLEKLESHLSGFLAKNASEQAALVKALDDQMWDGPNGETYREIKQLITIGYYTSEVGASEELAYDPVPGPFHPVSIEEYDRTWST